MSKKAKPVKPKCECNGEMCSGELMAQYVFTKGNKTKTFWICGVCVMLLRRAGHKLKQA